MNIVNQALLDNCLNSIEQYNFNKNQVGFYSTNYNSFTPTENTVALFVKQGVAKRPNNILKGRDANKALSV